MPSLVTLIRRGVREIIADLDLGPAVISGFLAPGKATDSAIGVTAYIAGDINHEIGAGQTIVVVQVTTRGSVGGGSDPVDDWRQEIHDALTWTTPRDVNGVQVSWSLQKLKPGPLYGDEQSRPIGFDNFDMSAGRLGLIPTV